MVVQQSSNASTIWRRCSIPLSTTYSSIICTELVSMVRHGGSLGPSMMMPQPASILGQIIPRHSTSGVEVSLVSAIIFTCDRLSPRGARIYRIGSLDPWSLSGLPWPYRRSERRGSKYRYLGTTSLYCKAVHS